jgi:hypothetical protein
MLTVAPKPFTMLCRPLLLNSETTGASWSYLRHGLTDGLCSIEHFKEAESGEFPFMQAKNIPTWEINPNLPWNCPFLQAEQKRDEDKFWTEYGARFRGNKSSLLGC